MDTTSLIHGPYMSTEDCSSWWRLYDGMGRLKLSWYGTPDTSLTGDRIAIECLQEQSSEFRHFLWPTKSSYMNIVAHISDALPLAVQKRSPSSLTQTDLWTALQDPWGQLPSALLQTLIESIPRRVVKLLPARGGHTRY
ncbi:uncharacterized protein TNCV_939381 [Trichonephila clavipes]|nr:uncharacterized protein TNCV_939381 [Trichonephila clavipes]